MIVHASLGIQGILNFLQTLAVDVHSVGLLRFRVDGGLGRPEGHQDVATLRDQRTHNRQALAPRRRDMQMTVRLNVSAYKVDRGAKHRFRVVIEVEGFPKGDQRFIIATKELTGFPVDVGIERRLAKHGTNDLELLHVVRDEAHVGPTLAKIVHELGVARQHPEQIIGVLDVRIA